MQDGGCLRGQIRAGARARRSAVAMQMMQMMQMMQVPGSHYVYSDMTGGQLESVTLPPA